MGRVGGDLQSVVRIKDEESGAERSFRGMEAKSKIAQSRAKPAFVLFTKQKPKKAQLSEVGTYW